MEKKFYKDYFVLEKKHWWFKARRNILLYFIKKYSRKGDKVFDFGCGSGYLVGKLQKNGYDAYGMDFESEAIEYGRNCGIKNLEIGSGGRFNYPDNSFDFITVLDVLEHIKNEKPVIAELKRVLKPGGKILVTVPAYMWLWGVQDEVAHHFRRYTVGSLNTVFDEFKDLNIIKKTYFNTLLFPAIVMVRFLSKLFNKQERGSDFEINNNFSNQIFYFIFNFEKQLLKFIKFPFGISILFILDKR